MKIGLYTIHEWNNYGAMLQTFATCEALKMLNVEVEVVNLYTKQTELENSYLSSKISIKALVKNIYALLSPSIHRKKKNFKLFHDRLPLSKRFYSTDEVFAEPIHYNLHLVGSDQTWNLEKGFSEKNYFWLDFLPENERKASFAASFGAENVKPELLSQIHEKLKSFSYVTTREESGVRILKAANINSFAVMDPTFLIDWNAFVSKEPLISGDYILAYGFGAKGPANYLIKQIKNIFNDCNIVGVSVSTTHPFAYDKFYQKAGPLEFLNLIKNAKFVITASFHGAAFAIHFRKNFFVLAHDTRNSRIESMLLRCGLLSQMIYPYQPILQNATKIDYSTVNEKIKDVSIETLKKLKEIVTC
ncbi:polysaccharide pyruvyl transferase family protein [Candidatus Saccharibacteria bacterium]|nr:polysaccharide pyruvyl transferase family protein [Candidatus Saccharibacteria bacterium]